MKQLSTICLHGNGLLDINEDIGNLENLKTLTLSKNKIKTFPKSLSKLSKLEDLAIENNPDLENIDVDILKLPNLKEFCVDEGILKLEVNSQRKEFYSIRKSFLFKLLKWFNISHHNIDHFNEDTIIAICNDNLKAISNDPYHSYIKIKIENDAAVSILSSKFTIINDLEIIDLAQKYNIDKISRDDFSLRIYTTIKENSEPIVGDRFGYGFNITNSETGFSSVKSEHFILRYFCTNGATNKITTNNHSFNHYKMDKNYVRNNIIDILDNSKSISDIFDEKVRNAQQIKA